MEMIILIIILFWMLIVLRLFEAFDKERNWYHIRELNKRNVNTINDEIKNLKKRDKV